MEDIAAIIGYEIGLMPSYEQTVYCDVAPAELQYLRELWASGSKFTCGMQTPLRIVHIEHEPFRSAAMISFIGAHSDA